MSGPPMAKSMNFAEQDGRPVLGPAGNKARSVELRKPVVKVKSEKVVLHSSEPALLLPEMTAEKIPSPVGFRKSLSNAASILRQRQHNLSLNASCSSEASTDSSQSRASTGRISRRSSISTPPLRRKQQCNWKGEKMEGNGKIVGGETECTMGDDSLVKKRCAWVTSNTDPLYTVFHDEEWGLPVHDDKKLFELLSFSTALAELTWPAILSKRSVFRDVFLDFDPVAVSKLNDKKIASPGSPASALLSELKLRSIIENALQVCKIIDEIGSFDKYIWGFVNYKPIVGNFRYPRQVPIKTSKADSISKDLVRRGFRGVGPTAVYSFMQVSGITNDHLITCFRHHDCTIAGDSEDTTMPENDQGHTSDDVAQSELSRDIDESELSRDIDDLNLSR